MRRSESEKKRQMEKKLREYYQTLVRPVDEWGPFYEEQKMLDGTDVDAQIAKKRAHKNIMAETFVAEKSRFKMRKKKKMPSKRDGKDKKDQDDNWRQQTRETSPNDFLDFLGDEANVSGYIFDGPNIISID